MGRTLHGVFVFIMVAIVAITIGYITYTGISYYYTDITERFFHPDYENLKPSGIWGHGMGIIGTFLILFGVLSYILRKRLRSLGKIGLLKYWLEFHIFLCTLGPVLVLYHTSFKFGGIVAVSFWSMVAVFLSGIIGRFIYIQIPRSIEGRELTLNEVKAMQQDLGSIISEQYNLDVTSLNRIITSAKDSDVISNKNFIGIFYKRFTGKRKAIRGIKMLAKQNSLKRSQYREIISLVKNEISLGHRIARLNQMQKLFKYWHVAHLPFALIMLIVVIIHVIVTITFGYRWIF